MCKDAMIRRPDLVACLAMNVCLTKSSMSE